VEEGGASTIWRTREKKGPCLKPGYRRKKEKSQKRKHRVRGLRWDGEGGKRNSTFPQRREGKRKWPFSALYRTGGGEAKRSGKGSLPALTVRCCRKAKKKLRLLLTEGREEKGRAGRGQRSFCRKSRKRKERKEPELASPIYLLVRIKVGWIKKREEMKTSKIGF